MSRKKLREKRNVHIDGKQMDYVQIYILISTVYTTV